MFEKNRNQESRRVGLGHGREGIRRLKDHQCWGPRSASGPAPHAGNWKGGQNRGTSRLSRKKKKKNGKSFRETQPSKAGSQNGDRNCRKARGEETVSCGCRMRSGLSLPRADPVHPHNHSSLPPSLTLMGVRCWKWR